jgi:hypothetical protein
MTLHYKANFLFAFALLLAILSCKKENEHANSAANRIAQSEKLVIPAEVDLPGNLPAGNTRVATYYAKGVQKYKAQIKAGSDPESYEWVFVGPKADLYDTTNAKVGIHASGPFWAISHLQTGMIDSIFAQQFSPARTVTVDAGSIPWLLLKPKEGKTPGGIFIEVDYIQRIATTGGKAPNVGPKAITDTADVFYTAIYRFSKGN